MLESPLEMAVGRGTKRGTFPFQSPNHGNGKCWHLPFCQLSGRAGGGGAASSTTLSLTQPYHSFFFWPGSDRKDKEKCHHLLSFSPQPCPLLEQMSNTAAAAIISLSSSQHAPTDRSVSSTLCLPSSHGHLNYEQFATDG